MAIQSCYQLHSATLDVLDRIGVRIDSDPALQLLALHGIRVDVSTRRAFPAERHIEKALASVPSTFQVCGRNANAQPLHVGGGTPYIIAGGASVRVLELNGRYAPATWEHLRRFTTLLDALPEIDLLLNQVDPVDHVVNYYVRIAAEMLIGSSKPCVLQVQSLADIEAIIAMGACIRGSRETLRACPLFLTGTNAEPPLCIPAQAASVLIAAATAGIPCGLGDYVMMGVTAPITLAGALVQRNAVQLTGLLLMQSACPGAPCYYSAPSGASCMHTLNPLTANFQAIRLLRASLELGRTYGLPVWMLAATDAREPDAQAACERMICLQAAYHDGAALIQGPTSSMDQMMLSSFAQVIIDHDIISYLRAGTKEIEVNADTVAMQAIEDVVTDLDYCDAKFAVHPHTIAHLRDAAWQPLAFEYGTFTEWQQCGAPSLVDRANARATQLLANHQPAAIDSSIAAKIFAIAE